MAEQAERLQKYMARAGVASRRASEKLIEAGRVKVNGRVVTKLGTKISPRRDEVQVDDHPITVAKQPTYIMVYKPRYVLSTTRDDRGRQTVLDLVESEARLFPVGRLDYRSEGLILLTDDGELTQQLTHPTYTHEREYEVMLDREPTRDILRQWRTGGFIVDGKEVGPMRVSRLAATGPGWLRIILQEGKKRQIREVARQLGFQVITLIRVRFGPLKLGNLQPGAWRHLTVREVTALQQTARTKSPNH